LDQLKNKYKTIIYKAGYKTTTPFQEKFINALTKKKHIIAEIYNGCGKTISITLPVIINTDFSFPNLKCLIIVSSYENAIKIDKIFKKFFLKKITSLQSIVSFPNNMRKDIRLLAKQPDILISTPENIITHIRSNNITLENIQNCIIEDSAIDDYNDFEKDIEFIFSKLNSKQQFMVFTKNIKHSYSFYQLLKKPLIITIEDTSKNPKENNYMQIDKYIQDIVSEIKNSPALTNFKELKKTIKRNVPFFMRGYFAAWLLYKLCPAGLEKLEQSSVTETNSKTTIFINTGKNRGFFEKDIVNIILSSKAAEKKDIKNIKIFDNYSFVTTKPGKLDAVTGAINNSMFKGKKLIATPAKNRQ
jgi:superfamily II DNA/RNA helicase